MEIHEGELPELKPVNQEPEGTGKKSYAFAVLCHLLSLSALAGIPFGNLLGPLIIWLIKRDEDTFVDACGKTSLNFQLSLVLYLLGLSVLILVPGIGMLLRPMIFIIFSALLLANVVLVIIASIKASHGELYRYPYSLQFLK